MIEIDVEIQRSEIQKAKKFHPIRLFSCILIPLVVIGGVGVYLGILYEQYAHANEAKVEAEIHAKLATPTGLSLPDSDAGDPLAQYKQINAVLPYSQTTWKTLNNLVFNFGFTYPTNTSAIIHNAAGNEIWLLRRGGYMFKVDIEQGNESEQDWLNSYRDKNEYTVTKTTFAKKPALFLQMIPGAESITGNEYVVADNGSIFLIWYETFPQGQYPDDQERIAFILHSFYFLK